MRHFHILRYLIILLALVCTACGTALPTVKPYKLDVQQGNVVSSKMLLQLRPGMTKSQVRFIMGTPLIQDSFHGNRWDYVYQMREGGKVTEQRRVILDFENELLKSVRGDVIPAGSDPAKSDESSSKTGTRVVAPYKKPEEKSLLGKLKFWEKDEAALAKEAAEKESALKLKAEADLAQKKTEAPVAQSITPPPAEEPKLLLAVPIEVTPAAAVLPNTPSVAATPVVEVPKVDAVVAAEPLVAQAGPVEKPLEVLPATEAAPAPVKSLAYESSAGMVFDKNLRYVPEEPEPAVKPVVEAPRAGNKEVPKPKELPVEGEPSFFDRMLEKIGF